MTKLGKKGVEKSSAYIFAGSLTESNFMFSWLVYSAETGVNYRKLQKGRISEEEFKKRSQERAAGTIGGIAGGSSGAVAGFYIGSMIMPGVGSVIGGVIGGLTGGFYGDSLATEMYKDMDKDLEKQRKKQKKEEYKKAMEEFGLFPDHSTDQEIIDFYQAQNKEVSTLRSSLEEELKEAEYYNKKDEAESLKEQVKEVKKV